MESLRSWMAVPSAAAEPAAQQGEQAKPDEPAEPPRTYVVRKGDTLSELARRFGVTVRQLAAANDIADPDRIRAGRKLVIPAKGGPEERQPAGRDLVESALQYRGVPYRYAGMTSRGMDCSGLVARVLLAHGIRAPHNSAALYRLGQAVSREDLRPGDLVFFNTTGKGISHVGIYVGDGEFVHASSGKGEVRTDTLESGYYAKRYVGARRIP